MEHTEKNPSHAGSEQGAEEAESLIYPPTIASSPAINQDDTLRLLRLISERDKLDGVSDAFTFQTFDDDNKRNDGDLVETLHGSYKRHARELRALNSKGACVAVMINRGNLTAGKKESVVECRAFVLDLDGAPTEPVYSSIEKGELPSPHVIHETSPGRYHLWWFVKDCPKEEFEDHQRILARSFGGDPSLADLCKKARLPGFLHQKPGKEPFRSRIVKCVSSLEELPPYPPDVVTGKLRERPQLAEPVRDGPIPEGGRHSAVRDFAWSRMVAGVTKEEGLEDTLRFNAERCQPPLPKKEVESLVKSAFRKKLPNATVQDYVDFVKGCDDIKDMRRDIMSDDLMLLTNAGWEPTANCQSYFRGYSDDSPVKVKLKHNLLLDKLERYKRDSMTPQLLIDLPEWDRVDRLEQIAEVMSFQIGPGTGCLEFYDLIKHWGADVWRRALYDHTIQPYTVIFCGPQGCGKDSLIDALTGGFGPYAKNLSLNSYALKETEAQLHTAMVFRIEEFSRTGRDAPVLKYLLSTSETSVRLPYDKKDQKRRVRCSFIGSDNHYTPFTDFTGNRRFWLFRAIDMGFDLRTHKPKCDYPGLFCRSNFRDERSQIVAQFKYLAEEQNYRAAEENIDAMRRVVADATPDDPDLAIVADFDEELRRLPARNSLKAADGAPLFDSETLKVTFSILCARHNLRSDQTLREILGRNGRRSKVRGLMYYRAGRPGARVLGD